MRRPHPALVAVFLAAIVSCIAPVAGCGGKKKSPLTIAQRLDNARGQPSDEAKARELTKVARLQARSSDRSGASKTLSEARSLLTVKPPRKQPPPQEQPQETAPQVPAEGGEAAATGGPTPPPAEGTAPADGGAAAEEGVAAPDAAAAAPQPATTDAPGATEPAPPADGQAAAPEQPVAADGDAPAVDAAPPEPEKVINPVLAGPLLVEIASVYALIGERGTAKDVLGQARKLLPKIEDVIIKAQMLAEAGGIYGAKTGGLADASNARKVLAEAAGLTEQIEERFRPESLAAVAMGYVTAGLAKDASEKVANLETLARSAEDRPKAEGLAVAATVRGQTGDKDGAKALLDEAGEAAKAIGGHENRTYALLAVARATNSVGERKAALGLVTAAEKSAAKIGDPEAQKNALEKVRALRGEIEKRK